MSYAILPALRVKEAAEKAMAGLPRAAGAPQGGRDQAWFNGLIGLCRAVLADPKGDHDVAVEASDFSVIMAHYDFTDPRLLQHDHASGLRRVGRD